MVLIQQGIEPRTCTRTPQGIRNHTYPTIPPKTQTVPHSHTYTQRGNPAGTHIGPDFLTPSLPQSELPLPGVPGLYRPVPAGRGSRSGGGRPGRTRPSCPSAGCPPGGSRAAAGWGSGPSCSASALAHKVG